MLVKFTVEVPKNLNNEQKEALKVFADASGESNYKTQKSFFDKMKDVFDTK